MVMAALALHGVDDGFDNDEGHAHTDDAQRIPQAAVKYIVAHIPNPLKAKWKHLFFSLCFGCRSVRFNGIQFPFLGKNR